jgi:ubiquinone/menaquinone biosynthesis C-methylase UbiE
MLSSIFWKKYFSTYDVLNQLIPYNELLDTLVDLLEIKPNDLVLDAGAGTGNLSLKIKEKGAVVVALDSSIEGLDMISLKDDSIRTVLHDITKVLPFPDNYFNKIVSNNVIYTIDQNQRPFVLKEFRRILKSNGKIVLSNVIKGWRPIDIYKNHLNRDYKKLGFLRLFYKIFKMIVPTAKMFYFNYKIKKEEGTGNFLSIDEQKKLLKEAGFSDISENQFAYANQAIINSAYKNRIL